MPRYLIVAIVGFAVTTASSVFAQDHLIVSAIGGVPSTAASLVQGESQSPSREEGHFKNPHRPWPLPALYSSSVFFESYDAFLTLSALKKGGKEANPILKPFSDYPVAFVAAKAGLTAVSFMGAERLWKRNHRASAVTLMVLSNAMMVVVTAHNNAVLQRLK